MSEGNDYFKVTAMSAAFRKWDAQHTTAGNMDDYHNGGRMWELRFLCAIAQQLTIIAGHLGTIVGKAKELKNGSD